MPFFADRFVFKKAPVRKPDAIATGYRSLTSNDARIEFGADFSAVSLTLDGRRAVFDETSGKWVWSCRSSDVRDSSDTDKLHKVSSENRLLRLKIEILTDLVRRVLLVVSGGVTGVRSQLSQHMSSMKT